MATKKYSERWSLPQAFDRRKHQHCEGFFNPIFFEPWKTTRSKNSLLFPHIFTLGLRLLANCMWTCFVKALHSNYKKCCLSKGWICWNLFFFSLSFLGFFGFFELGSRTSKKNKIKLGLRYLKFKSKIKLGLR